MNEASERKKRTANVTEEQRNLLVEFMAKHPQLVSGKFSQEFTYKDASALWETVANILNACNGAKRDWKSWRKTWQDLRSRTKSKGATIKRHCRQTGGGPACTTTLNASEERVIQLLSPTAISGISGVRESTMGDLFNDEDEEPPTSEIVEFLETDDLMTLYRSGEESAQLESFEVEEPQQDSAQLESAHAEESQQEAEASLSTENRHLQSSQPKKRQTAQERLNRTAHAADCLSATAERTYQLRKNHYEIMQELKRQKVALLERFVTAVETLVSRQ